MTCFHAGALAMRRERHHKIGPALKGEALPMPLLLLSLVMGLAIVGTAAATTDLCSELDSSDPLSGIKVYEGCQVSGRDRAIGSNIDLTLRGITWTGGSITFGTTNVKLRVEDSNFTDMAGQIFVVESTNEVRNVTLYGVKVLVRGNTGSAFAVRADDVEGVNVTLEGCDIGVGDGTTGIANDRRGIAAVVPSSSNPPNFEVRSVVLAAHSSALMVRGRHAVAILGVAKRLEGQINAVFTDITLHAFDSTIESLAEHALTGVGVSVLGRDGTNTLATHITMTVQQSSVTANGDAMLSSVGVLSWCWDTNCHATLNVEQATIDIKDSHVNASGPNSGVIAAGLGNFRQPSSGGTTTTISDVSILACSSTIFASEAALDVVVRRDRQGTPGRFTSEEDPDTLTNSSLVMLDTTVTTEYSGWPGNCLRALPQATANSVAPSVIRDSVLDCSGLPTATMAADMLFVSNATDGGGAAFAPPGAVRGYSVEPPLPEAATSCPAVERNDCRVLAYGGVLRGEYTFADCVIDGADSAIESDAADSAIELTLRNVSWTGGSVTLPARNVRLRVEDSNFTDMTGDALCVHGGSGTVSNVSLLAVGVRIRAELGSALSVLGDLPLVEDVNITMERCDVAVGLVVDDETQQLRGVGSVVPTVSSNTFVVRDVALKAVWSSLVILGRGGLACVGLLKRNFANLNTEISRVSLLSFDSSLTTEGFAGDLATLGLTVAARDSSSESELTITNLAIRGERSSIATTSGVNEAGAMGIIVWAFQVNVIVLENWSVTAVDCVVEAEGDAVTAALGLSAHTRATISLTATDTNLMALRSTIKATGENSRVVAAGMGVFGSNSDASVSCSVTNFSITSCGSTIHSSEVALEAAARGNRDGSPFRFVSIRDITISEYSVTAYRTTVTTEYAYPLGNCLMALPQATANSVAPSVIRDSVLDCSGLPTATMAADMLFVSNATDGGGAAFAPPGTVLSNSLGPVVPDVCTFARSRTLPLTASPSLSPSLPPTASASTSASVSASQSVPPTGTLTSTLTRSSSPTPTPTQSATPGRTASRTLTRSLSPSRSQSASKAGTPSQSRSLTPPPSITFPMADGGTVTPTSTLSPTVSLSGTSSLTCSHTRTRTGTPTRTPTHTPSLTHSPTTLPAGCAVFSNRATCHGSTSCYWSALLTGCMSTSFQARLPVTQVIDGFEIPSSVAQGSALVATLFGAPPRLQRSWLLLHAAGAPCPAEGNASAWAAATNATLEGDRFVFRFTSVNGSDSSVWWLCVMTSEQEVLVVEGASITVSADAAPALTRCEFGEFASPIYAGSPFPMRFAGFNLGRGDRFGLVASAPGELPTPCPNASASPEAFFAVRWAHVAGNESTARFSVAARGTYRVCYIGHNSSVTTTTCPQPLLVEGLPPWVDPKVLSQAVAEMGPLHDAANISAFNRAHCRSLQVTSAPPLPEGFDDGPLLAPRAETMTARFGTLMRPYAVQDTCAVLVQPVSHPDPSRRGAVELRVSMGFMDDSDKVVVFAPSNVTPPELAVQDTHPSTTFVTACVASVPGFTRVAVLTPDPAVRNPLQQVQRVRTPAGGGGVLVIFCSDAQQLGGLSATLTYSQEATLCPNDCRDSTGTQRGMCNATTRQCVCEPNWAGATCASFQGCAGVGEAAQRMVITDETVAYTHNASRAEVNEGCGYHISASDEQLPRSGPFGIAFHVTGARIESLDCTSAFLEVRAGGVDGQLLARVCGSDTQREEGLRTRPRLVNAGTTIYVVFRGTSDGDGFAMRVRAVALTCPGDTDSSGFVNASAVCSGHGRCVGLDYSTQSGMPESSQQCVCAFPFAASTTGATCDACAFGLNASTFPECAPRAACPRDCSNRGRCTGEGCLCDAGYFGRGCEDVVVPVEVKPKLGVRLPLDRAAGSNAIFAGSVDKTLLSCEGDPARCLQVTRMRGKALNRFELEDSRANPTPQPPPAPRPQPRRIDGDSGGNNESAAGEAEAPPPAAAANDAPLHDEGVLLNRMWSPGSIGDYIRIDDIANTTRDFAGALTVSAWVQVTRDTHGFLMAKADAAFYADGRNPVLDRAALDAEDRHVAHDELELPRYPFHLYFAIFINGPRQRIDVVFTDPATRQVAIRHFRLGGLASTLFDGTWRFLTMEFGENSIGELEGVAYVDGRTARTDPGLIQCFPFLPTDVQPNNATIDADEMLLQVVPGGTLVVGYGFEGALDEVRLYGDRLDHTTIVSIAGDDFVGALFLNTRALLVLGVFGVVSMVLTGVLVLVRKQREQREEAQQQEVARRRRRLFMQEPETTIAWARKPGDDGGTSDADAPDEPTHTDDAFARDGIDDVVPLAVVHSATGATKATPKTGEAESENFNSVSAEDDREREAELAWMDSKAAEFESELAGSPGPQHFRTTASAKLERFKRVVSDGGTGELTPDDTRGEAGEGELTRPPADDEDDAAVTPVLEAAAEDEPSSAEGAQTTDFGARELKRPDPVDPRTWGIFLCGPAAEERSRVRRLSVWLRRRYDVLERSRDGKQQDTRTHADKNRVMLLVESLAAREYTSYQALHEAARGTGCAPQWELSAKARASFEEMLAQLEMYRVCKSEDERDRFTAALEKLSAMRESDDAVISRAADDVPLLVAVIHMAGILEPADSYTNRQLLLGLAGILEGSRQQEFSLRRLLYHGALVGRSAESLQQAGVISSGASASVGIVKQLQKFANKMSLTTRSGLLLDQWQIVGLLLSAMSWPTLYTRIFGPLTAIASLKPDLAFNVHFAVGFYLTAVVALVSFAVLCYFVVVERHRSSKDLEMDVRAQIDAQVERIATGKEPWLSKTRRQKVCWTALMLLSALDIPATRNAVLAVFCHPSLFCIYDCYHDSAHRVLVVVGIATFVFVTFLMPALLFVLARRKRDEFLDFVGDVSAYPSLQARLWVSFASCDPSPYKSIYTGFLLKFVAFRSFQVATNALMCFLTLGITPDTTAQAVAVLLVQAGMTFALGVIAPYTDGSCNWMMLRCQLFVLLTLVLQAFHRIDPDERDAPIGTALVAVGFLSLAYEFYAFGPPCPRCLCCKKEYDGGTGDAKAKQGEDAGRRQSVAAARNHHVAATGM